MSIDELRELERRLEEAEDLFLDSRNYTLESQALWQGLRELLVSITAQRLRLEMERDRAAERKPTATPGWAVEERGSAAQPNEMNSKARKP